uniref:Immunoglobulin domain-containing protein n=1 Tax=Sphaeramia orbicularis TaxID=375764 RepID=A0A673CJN3_9TELE
IWMHLEVLHIKKVYSSFISYVTVEKGGSISIPCFYESKYTDNEKYLCKGCKWKICSYEVKTNQYNSTKYLISDDQNQGVVTWTINDLTEEDTDCYWCVMEINHRPDNGKCFNVRDATLYVDSQEVTGFIGDQITIDCHYRGSKQIKWCRTGGEGHTSCIEDSGKIDDTKVTINRNTPGVITVTMSELRERSSGWYWCTDEDLQMPVHVTIKERPTTMGGPTGGRQTDKQTNPGKNITSLAWGGPRGGPLISLGGGLSSPSAPSLIWIHNVILLC